MKNYIRPMINNILRDIIRWQNRRERNKRWVRTWPEPDTRDQQQQDRDRLAILKRQDW